MIYSYRFHVLLSIIFLLSLLLSGCIMFHNMNPVPKKDHSIYPNSKCVRAINFKTMIDGIPPDIEVKDSNITITPDQSNGQSDKKLDSMVKEVFNEYGILSSNSKEGIDVKDGIFIQINNRITVPPWAYGSIFLSLMTATIIPGYNSTEETIDVSVFESRKMLFKKHYKHSVKMYQWILLLPFFWVGDDSNKGQLWFKDVIRDVTEEVILRKEGQNGRCM